MPWEILKISNSSQKRNCPDTPHFWVTVCEDGYKYKTTRGIARYKCFF